MSSVCLSASVTLVDFDHIGWKSWKLIARPVSPTPSKAKAHPPTPRGDIEKFWGDERSGGKKWRAGAQKRQYLWNA